MFRPRNTGGQHSTRGFAQKVGAPKTGRQTPRLLHTTSNSHSLQWLYTPAGLEESLSNMSRGEKAIFSCPAEYAQGSSLLPNPPSTSDRVELELHLLSLTQVSKVKAKVHLFALFWVATYSIAWQGAEAVTVYAVLHRHSEHQMSCHISCSCSIWPDCCNYIGGFSFSSNCDVWLRHPLTTHMHLQTQELQLFA